MNIKTIGKIVGLVVIAVALIGGSYFVGYLAGTGKHQEAAPTSDPQAEIKVEGGTVSLADITENPAKYLGKTVSVKGNIYFTNAKDYIVLSSASGRAVGLVLDISKIQNIDNFASKFETPSTEGSAKPAPMQPKAEVTVTGRIDNVTTAAGGKTLGIVVSEIKK